MNKKISVIMGIYNCEKTLSEAIESILAQTYTNWELIMCDDGSSDDTYKVAESYRAKYPEKITLLQNKKNMGLNHTLNLCLEHATGSYIARQDGDDISLPERFTQEVSVLTDDPKISIVSTPMIYFDESGDWGHGSSIEYPSPTDFISGTPFSHGPCMVRREAYEAVLGYSTDPHTFRAEDYHLWFRMYAAGYRGRNLKQPYYKMRDDVSAYHRRKFRYAINEAYVRFSGYRMLNLPPKAYLYVLRPIVVGLLPKPLYLFLHHRKQTKKDPIS